MKIKEMVEVFLNSANFAPYVILTLAPPNGYALNLKSLIEVSKVSWSSFERKFGRAIFFCEKYTSQKCGSVRVF